jgi:Flp pilus assembly protein TadG
MRTNTDRREPRQKRDGERGVMAVLMTLLLTTFLGFAALGFDLSYVRLARLEMKNATDAAAHAANVVLSITGDTAQAKAAAISVAHSHLVMGKPMKLTDADIVFGVYNFSTKTFTSNGTPPNGVQIQSQRFSSDDADPLVSLTFGKALGYTEADYTQTVTSAFKNRYFQLQVDITDSWLCDINQAADAAVALLDHLKGSGGSMGDWIGLDVFTAAATQLTPLKNVKYYYANPPGAGIHDIWLRDTSTLLTSQTKGIGVCNKLDATPTACDGTTPANEGGYRQCPRSPAVPCSSQFKFPNHSWLPRCSAGDRISGGYTLYGGTDLGSAIKAGADKLKAIGQPDETKILIIVTDGAPMICTAIGGGGLCGSGNCCSNGLTCGATYTVGGNNYGGGIYGDGWQAAGAPSESCLVAHNMTIDAWNQADLAAAAKIKIYTIGFFADSTSREATFSRSLARNGGFGITTNDSNQIDDWLKTIPSHQPPAIVK